MKTTKITHVAHLVEICVQHGISKVVVSPGSRNAPLVVAFDSHPKIDLYLVHDERSAAFFAMGLAEESKSPVAITCTSGSAPVNYAPALSEAYYRNIPLLVLTADRPVEWVDQGDGQTIRQKHLFQNFIKADFELPNFPDKSDRLRSDELVNQALNTLTGVPFGPVHINIPLAEPLYETQELQSSPQINTEIQQTRDLSDDEKTEISEVWNRAAKKLVLIGQLDESAISVENLKVILEDPSVAVVVENTSNLKDFRKIVHCIDRTLAAINEQEMNDFIPDLLVTMGGAVISKKIKALFRKNKPVTNWRIGQYFFEEDTYGSLSRSYEVNPNVFFRHLEKLEMLPLSNFGNKWKQRDFMAEERHNKFLSHAPYSDLKVFDLLLDTIPEGSNLHMSNSSVVRYCQLFNPVRGMQYYANRGVSGIDGSTSTAVGIAVQSKEKLNVMISGDISFFYDSNAFWNAHIPANFRIIVINNGGGGIFKIIDGPNNSDQSAYFVAEHSAKVKGICEAFNLHYLKADSLETLESSIEAFYTETVDQRPIVMEVDTTNVENEKILAAYFRQIGERI